MNINSLEPVTHNYSILVTDTPGVIAKMAEHWLPLVPTSILNSLVATAIFSSFSYLFNNALKENRKIAVDYLAVDEDTETDILFEVTRLLETSAVALSIFNQKRGTLFTAEDRVLLGEETVDLTNKIMRLSYYTIREAIDGIMRSEPIDSINTIACHVKTGVIAYTVSFTLNEKL